MAKKPYENSDIESFHSFLKEEEVYRRGYINSKKSNAYFFEYIEF